MLRSVGGVRLSPEAWRYLAVLTSISIATMYVEMVIMPSLLTIERQYGMTESEVSWVFPDQHGANIPNTGHAEGYPGYWVEYKPDSLYTA